jgi:GT2 family glycosyltransferase
MAKTATASIIIPVFNQAALTKQCLETILGCDHAEIIVVNDASTDGTAKMLAAFGSQIKVITHKTNAGFAKSCNDGAKIARGKFLIFLNNDTIPQRGWLAALLRYADKNPKAAVVGAKLLYPSDTIQHAGVVICQDKYPRHLYTGFPAHHPAVCQSRRFQVVTAAAMLVRKNLFTALRGFDARFRNGFEDVDFCLRLGRRGHEVHYCADSVVQHLESVSPGRFTHDKHNIALYRQRWLKRVQPDDLNYFLADGLLSLNYEGSFPLHLKISPDLAVVDAGRGDALEKNLADKSRQVADLTREITKLRAELGGADKASPALQLDRDREGIRAQVRLATPPDAKMLVVSKGDRALLELDGRAARHFPQTDRGVYLGHHPADSAEAIARLEALRKLGAEYILFPATSFWWLEHYGEFKRHLETIGSLVQRDDHCVIYSLHRLALARPKKPARVIALLTARNEERFIGNCLAHHIRQGIQIYFFDHGSTDRTVEIAQPWLGRGLLAIEKLPAEAHFSLRDQLARHHERRNSLDADWFMQIDADEIHLAPSGFNLPEALAAVSDAGYNAVNFQEFTFVPTAESPDHDHADYLQTMRSYYPFLPRCPWGIRAVHRSAQSSLNPANGHQPTFDGMRLCPLFFPMKHYQFMSVAQAGRKYSRRYARTELDAGHHGGHQGWRALFRAENFPLLSANSLCAFSSDAELDVRSPRLRHLLDEQMQALLKGDAQ